MSESTREHTQPPLDPAPGLIAAPPELLTVSGPMSFARAVELRGTLISALENHAGPLDLDLSGVTELDSAGVQILLLVKATANAQNRALRLAGQSSAVLSTLELLRLQTHFGAPQFVLFGEGSL